jgi:hypothetical protein
LGLNLWQKKYEIQYKAPQGGTCRYIFFCRDAIFSFTFFAAENAVFFSWFFALFLQTANCAAKHGSIFLAPPTFGGECNNL